MKTLLRHPHRLDVRDEIETTDPRTDYESIYRATCLREFPWDTVTALNLAFYRVFAAPRMARLLVQTGELENRPMKRSEDTGLIMYEMIADGLNGPRGREVIRQMNQMHKHWSIAPEDYAYVLAAFVVVPTRWINDFGWRALTSQEVEATVAFYTRLGRLMGITGFPRTYAEIERLFDDYEREHLRYTPEAARLLDATRAVVAGRLPERAQFLAGPLLRVLMSEPLCRCFGVTPAGPVLRGIFRAGITVRKVHLRRQPPREGTWFTPVRPMRSYPQGYRLEDLGTDAARQAAATDQR